LGTFDSEEDAARAYDRKARDEKGTKSQTNFDDAGNEIVPALSTVYNKSSTHSSPTSESGKANGENGHRNGSSGNLDADDDANGDFESMIASEINQQQQVCLCHSMI
jgi:hypothetical protein